MPTCRSDCRCPACDSECAALLRMNSEEASRYLRLRDSRLAAARGGGQGVFRAAGSGTGSTCSCGGHGDPQTVTVPSAEWERLKAEAGRPVKPAAKRPAPPPPPDAWGLTAARKAREAARPKPVDGGPNGWAMPEPRPLLKTNPLLSLATGRPAPPPVQDSWGIEAARKAAAR